MQTETPEASPSYNMKKAAEFAVKMHGMQKYGNRPYVNHLADVALTLWNYGHTSKEIQAAAWLHDIIEDTPADIELVRELFGDEVAEIVWAVTDEPGATRRIRKMATYPKIAKNSKAIIVKIADRICNVRECIKMKNHDMLKKYDKEQDAFEKALRNGENVAMWNELRQLLKRVG